MPFEVAPWDIGGPQPAVVALAPGTGQAAFATIAG
ncbi:hypothetical protein H4W32_000528 [Actinophytocola algeriensis]|uniref:Uncharacterized protein n=1 Tax=Actinophytocola algeriensis TaxID=1768010 RepID=A0A7W7Q2I9_9PSEU|nr:hypothetical protein [Actinophytocola algeriensis]MBE1472486.1 hypothetical protein [Actinophytocola algeriensis]